MVISVYAEIPSSSSLSLAFLFPSPPFLVLSWAVLSDYSLLCAWQSSVVDVKYKFPASKACDQPFELSPWSTFSPFFALCTVTLLCKLF